MRNHKYMGAILAGLGAGVVTGLFGAGGGMILVPLLTLLTDIPEEEIFPSSIAVILPICVTALTITAITGTVSFQEAIPYLIGSAAGGAIAGKWGQRIPTKWLHRLLGILILWGGVRYLC